jgi:hypothetical protein
MSNNNNILAQFIRASLGLRIYIGGDQHAAFMNGYLPVVSGVFVGFDHDPSGPISVDRGNVCMRTERPSREWKPRFWRASSTTYQLANIIYITVTAGG